MYFSEVSIKGPLYLIKSLYSGGNLNDPSSYNFLVGSNCPLPVLPRVSKVSKIILLPTP